MEVQKNDEVLGLTTAKTQASTSDQQPSINKTMALAQLSPLNPSNLSVNEKSAEELPAKVSTGKHVSGVITVVYWGVRLPIGLQAQSRLAWGH